MQFLVEKEKKTINLWRWMFDYWIVLYFCDYDWLGQSIATDTSLNIYTHLIYVKNERLMP